MKKNWMKNNNLDEMQEQELLKIEHNGCWLAFWGLLAVMAVQQIIFGVDDPKMIAGEWIVFMVLAVYLSAACLKNGIWDRRLKADRRTNLLVSLVAAAAAALLFGGVALVRYHSAGGALAAALISLVLVFACCFAALSLTARSYKKTLARLESQGDEDAESD